MMDFLIQKTYAASLPESIWDGRGFDGTKKGLGDIYNSENGGYVGLIITMALNAAAVVAFIYILYAAFLYVKSQGNEAEAENAKKTLTWAILGLILVLAARAIVAILTTNKFLG
ncbi:MAG: hypothetical protein AAB360_00890 [Patescibacteria group bacterium]